MRSMVLCITSGLLRRVMDIYVDSASIDNGLSKRELESN